MLILNVAMSSITRQRRCLALTMAKDSCVQYNKYTQSANISPTCAKTKIKLGCEWLIKQAAQTELGKRLPIRK